GVWSPEDMLVGAVAACFAVTLAAVAERRQLPVRALDVRGTGHVSKHSDGRFGFVEVELEAEIATEPGVEAAVEEAAPAAERPCRVRAPLAFRVPVTTCVGAPPPLVAVGA